jgi:hypothetical protein
MSGGNGEDVAENLSSSASANAKLRREGKYEESATKAAGSLGTVKNRSKKVTGRFGDFEGQ